MQRIKDRSHQSKLAWRFEDLYRNRVLTDVILFTSDGMELKAHWLILAAYSEIFKQLAISNKTKKNNCVGTVVRLEFTSDIVAILLNYCYKGELIVTQGTKSQVQKAAQLLLMNDILKLLEKDELDAQDVNNTSQGLIDRVPVTLPEGSSGEATLSMEQEQVFGVEPADDADVRKLSKVSGIWPESLKSTSSLLKQFSEIVTLQSESGKLKPKSLSADSSNTCEKENSTYISLDLSNLERSKLQTETVRKVNQCKKKKPTIQLSRSIYRKAIFPRIRLSKETWKPSLVKKKAMQTCEKMLQARTLLQCCVTLDSLDTNDKLFLCRKCNKKFNHYSVWRLHYSSAHLLHLYQGVSRDRLMMSRRGCRLRTSFRRRRTQQNLFSWSDLNPIPEDDDAASDEGYPGREYDIDNNIQVTFQPTDTASAAVHTSQQLCLSEVSMMSNPPPLAQTVVADPQAAPQTQIQTPVFMTPQQSFPNPTLQQPQFSSQAILPTITSVHQPQQTPVTPSLNHNQIINQSNMSVDVATLQTADLSQPSALPEPTMPNVQQVPDPLLQTQGTQTQIIAQNQIIAPNQTIAQNQILAQRLAMTQNPALAQTTSLSQTSALTQTTSLTTGTLTPNPTFTQNPINSPNLTAGPNPTVGSTPPVGPNPTITIAQTLTTNPPVAPAGSKSSDAPPAQWLPSDSWMSFLQSDSFTASVLGPQPPQQQNTQYITMVKCSVKGCSFAGYSTRAVNKHMHDTHLNMECTYCMFACSDKAELERHIAERHERKRSRQYACSVCEKKFSKAIHHRTHEQSHHGINHNMKEYKCDLEGCEFITLAKHNYLKHKLTHEDKMYSCQYCGIKIRTFDYLQRHINKQHLNIRPFQCEHCGSAFGDMHALKSHISAVHVKKEFKCEHCSYAANIRYKVATHMYQVHGIRASFDKRKEIKCAHCSYTALVKSWMTKHMDRHATSRNYTCEHCGKTFGSPRNLNSHTRWAHKTAKHQCPHCEYITKTPTRLKNHIKTQHMFRGYKPYTCPYCPFKCATGGNCRKHVMQKHPGEEVTYNKNEELIAYMKSAGRQEEEEAFTHVVS